MKAAQDGKMYSPSQIGAFVLMKMKETAGRLSDGVCNQDREDDTFSVSPRAQSKEGGRIEMTTTSKGLMHSIDHIKENWATMEGRGGGGTAPPTLL